MNAELFEVAKVYLSAGEGLPEQEAEPTMVSMVTGRDFRQLKGVVESLIDQIAPTAELTVETADLPEFLNGRGAKLSLNGRLFGWLAAIP